MTRPSEAVAAWAARQFETSGASIERLVAAAVDQFCADPEWVRGFVVEQLRDQVTRGVTGMSRVIDITEAAGQGSDPERPAAPARPAPAIDPDKAPAKRRVLAAAKRETKTPAWAKALAIDPSARTFRPMLSLTREELLDGSHYLAGRAALCRAIADRLQPGQRVREAFTEEELSRLIGQQAAPAIAD